jgi:hypothetical protein
MKKWKKWRRPAERGSRLFSLKSLLAFRLAGLDPADSDKVLLAAVPPFVAPVIGLFHRIIGHFFHSTDTGFRVGQAEKFAAETALDNSSHG